MLTDEVLLCDTSKDWTTSFWFVVLLLGRDEYVDF
jgi:hypothetical protein